MDLTALNWADYAIIGIIAFSMLISLIRGFVREALSLASWIIAFWIALTFAGQLAELFANLIATPPLRLALAFFLLFAASLIVGALINFAISHLVKKTGLSGTDRLLGLVFGAGRGVILVAVLLLVGSLSKLPEEPWWQESTFIPEFKPVSDWLRDFLPENLEFDFDKAKPEPEPKTEDN